MNSDISRIVYSKEQIAEAVAQMGKKITLDYAGKSPLLVCILKGAVVFLADLMREIDLPCGIEFMQVSSYGANAVSSGKINIIKDLAVDISGRDVIIVEDILDSAQTLDSLLKVLSARKPASLKLCVFLDKKVERSVDLVPDYKCFDVENEFIVGYGLDYAQRYRSLPYVGVLKREVYEK